MEVHSGKGTMMGRPLGKDGRNHEKMFEEDH